MENEGNLETGIEIYHKIRLTAAAYQGWEYPEIVLEVPPQKNSVIFFYNTMQSAQACQTLVPLQRL